jgi:hypothetical protein
MILAEAPAANFWTAIPTLLWVGLIVTVLCLLWKPLSELIIHLVARIRAGAPMKIGSVEFGALRTEQHHVPSPTGESSSAPEYPESGAPYGPMDPLSKSASELTAARTKYYQETRRIMLVHRLFRSGRPDQVYDVLIYLLPHGQANLVEVAGVEYFFGRYWANKIFESSDRSRGFPILTSAYGTFLCCARVRFNDGSVEDLFRYVDFEMGAYAPLLTSNDDEK